MMTRIQLAQPSFNGQERNYLLDVLDSTRLTMHEYVKRFEQEFSEFNGTKHAVTCSSGTTALHLAMIAARIKAGDEVIVPALTYVATANAVRYVNATPVMVDVEQDTWCLNVDDVEKKITKRTRAVIAVHLYGYTADLDTLGRLCRDRDLVLIEDAAEALGSLYNGQACGTVGDIGTFSFFGNKLITTGEGGMLTSNIDSYANEARLYRGQGVDTSVHRYYHPVIGFNYRMTDMQAAIGCAQLEDIDTKMMQKFRVDGWYLKWFAAYDLPVRTQRNTNQLSQPVPWLVTVLLPESVSRDEVMREMDITHGIETRPTFLTLGELPPYEKYDRNQIYPVAQHVSRHGLSLPTHGGLVEDDVERVVAALKHCL